MSAGFWHAELWYYVWAALLVMVNAGAWAANFITLPGNWLVVGLTALFVLFVPTGDQQGIRWATVAIVIGLAGLGELIEFGAGAAGAAKEGGSRRGMVLAVLGAILGSVCGALAGVPIPIIGPLIGAVGGGALGAFVGAYLGEMWKGRSSEERLNVSTGALVGRLLGTVGKLAVGAVMWVVVAADAFF